jgi:hypothetical protein
MSKADTMKGTKQKSDTAKSRGGRGKRESVASILREAYRLHSKDRETKLAVRACLRMA